MFINAGQVLNSLILSLFEMKKDMWYTYLYMSVNIYTYKHIHTYTLNFRFTQFMMSYKLYCLGLLMKFL
jgi:hypothetical protein